MWSQLGPDCSVARDIIGNRFIGSTFKAPWLCSECGAVFETAVRLMRLSTGRCKAHTNAMKSRYRPRYDGDVPMPLRRPIRAGLLQTIGTDALVALVATLEPVVGAAAGAADPVAAALTAARGYVESIVARNYDRVQLLDSVFWGDDSVHRADGSVYVRPQRHRKRRCGDATQSPSPPPADGDAGAEHAVVAGGSALVPHPDYVLVAPPSLVEWNGLDTYEVESDAPDVESVLVRECNKYLQQIRYKLLAHWTDYALSFLKVPVPIGDRILCREHAMYCYIVLGALFKHYPDVAHGGFAGEIKVLRYVAELLNISDIHPYFLRCILDAIQTIDRAAGLV